MFSLSLSLFYNNAKKITFCIFRGKENYQMQMGSRNLSYGIKGKKANSPCNKKSLSKWS